MEAEEPSPGVDEDADDAVGATDDAARLATASATISRLRT
jgi:hypothetical protein